MYAQLNHCVTAFGKRLLKTWLARPLYHVESIKERQDAVSSLQVNTIDNFFCSISFSLAAEILQNFAGALALVTVSRRHAFWPHCHLIFNACFVVGNQLTFLMHLIFEKKMAKLPDMERLLARVFASW